MVQLLVKIEDGCLDALHVALEDSKEDDRGENELTVQ